MLVNTLQDVKFESQLVNRTHVGTVVDNRDPKGLQRLRVSIPRLTEGIPIEHLPWYSTKHPIGLGGARTSAFSIPEVGATVTVVFYTENIYTGIVDGILITEQNNQVNVALSNVPPDVPADFKNYATNVKTDPSEARGYVNRNYPESYGFIDSTGNWSRVDKKAQSMEFVHSSGSSFSIDKDGNVTIHITGNLTLVIDKDIQQTCINNVSFNEGNLFSRTDGNNTTYVGGIRSTETIGNSTEIVDGDKIKEYNGQDLATVASTKKTFIGGDLLAQAAGQVATVSLGKHTIKANRIDLN